MKTTIKFGITSIAVLLVAVGTLAQATTKSVDGSQGQTNGDIHLKGIIGSFDNTKPGPDPEDLEQWINVTIPTRTIFYSTEESLHREIESPEYTITNNSAKGVVVSVSGIQKAVGMDVVDTLNINGITSGGATISLFSNFDEPEEEIDEPETEIDEDNEEDTGDTDDDLSIEEGATPDENAPDPSVLFTLGNNTQATAVGKYTYSGTAIPRNVLEQVHPNFQLVLNFSPTSN